MNYHLLFIDVNDCYSHFMHHYCELPTVNFSSIVDCQKSLWVAFKLFLSHRRISNDQNIPTRQSPGYDHFVSDGAVLHLVYVLYHLNNEIITI